MNESSYPSLCAFKIFSVGVFLHCHSSPVQSEILLMNFVSYINTHIGIQIVPAYAVIYSLFLFSLQLASDNVNRLT